MNLIDFKDWILCFKNVDRPIGDLANDISQDTSFPVGRDRQLIRNYLDSRATFDILEGLLETFDDAWEYYLRDTRP